MWVKEGCIFVTLWCASPHNRLYEQLIAAFDASIRAINNNGETIAMALEKNAKFSFTIGENFSQF